MKKKVILSYHLSLSSNEKFHLFWKNLYEMKYTLHEIHACTFSFHHSSSKKSDLPYLIVFKWKVSTFFVSPSMKCNIPYMKYMHVHFFHHSSRKKSDLPYLIVFKWKVSTFLNQALWNAIYPIWNTCMYIFFIIAQEKNLTCRISLSSNEKYKLFLYHPVWNEIHPIWNTFFRHSSQLMSQPQMTHSIPDSNCLTIS